MQAVTDLGARLGVAASCAALGLPKATYYRALKPRPPRAKRSSHRALGAARGPRDLALEIGDLPLERVRNLRGRPALPGREPGQRTAVAGAPPLHEVRRIQALATEKGADLARLRARLGLGQDLELVLRGELPPAGLRGHLGLLPNQPDLCAAAHGEVQARPSTLNSVGVAVSLTLAERGGAGSGTRWRTRRPGRPRDRGGRERPTRPLGGRRPPGPRGCRRAARHAGLVLR